MASRRVLRNKLRCTLEAKVIAHFPYNLAAIHVMAGEQSFSRLSV
jgi:hypothetical protein